MKELRSSGDFGENQLDIIELKIAQYGANLVNDDTGKGFTECLNIIAKNSGGSK